MPTAARSPWRARDSAEIVVLDGPPWTNGSRGRCAARRSRLVHMSFSPDGRLLAGGGVRHGCTSSTPVRGRRGARCRSAAGRCSRSSGSRTTGPSVVSSGDGTVALFDAERGFVRAVPLPGVRGQRAGRTLRHARRRTGTRRLSPTTGGPPVPDGAVGLAACGLRRRRTRPDPRRVGPVPAGTGRTSRPARDLGVRPPAAAPGRAAGGGGSVGAGSAVRASTRGRTYRRARRSRLRPRPGAGQRSMRRQLVGARVALEGDGGGGTGAWRVSSRR